MFALGKTQRTHSRRNAAGLTAGMAALFAAAWLLEPLAAPASGFRSATPPSTPGNFHVTAVTDSSVSFAWTASKPGSDPSFVYEIVNATTGFINNVGTVSSYTWTFGLQAGDTYSFYIRAHDSDNKVSANSPTVTVTLPGPPPPPPQVQPDAPVITQVSVTPTSMTVSWSEATPPGEVGGYVVFVDGTNALALGAMAEGNTFFTNSTQWNIPNLTPDTTYTINIVAFSDNESLQTSSAPLNVTTTTPPNTIPPTAPSGLNGFGDGGGEAIINWNPSTSVNEPQSQIYYKIFINGVFDVFDSGVGQTTQVYIFPRGASVPAQVYVVAEDQYGNASAPSNILTLNGF